MSVQVQIAARRKAPWISTATWINNDNEEFNASQVIEAAKLNWKVQHTPLTTSVVTDSGVTNVDITNKVATTRVNANGSASVLGITSPSYSIVQNSDIVKIVDSVMFEAGAMYTSAGELRGGKKIFIAAKLPDTLELSTSGVDPIDTMLVASNTHDGTDSLRFQIMHLRQICTNGMVGWSKVNSISFRHTSRMNVQIEDVRQTLGVVLKANEEFNLMSSRLMSEKVANSDFWNIVTQLLPLDEDSMTERQIKNVEERRDVLKDIWYGPTQENIKGTAWGIVQAFGEFEQWSRTTKKADDFASAERFMLNQGNSLTEKALALVW